MSQAASYSLDGPAKSSALIFRLERINSRSDVK